MQPPCRQYARQGINASEKERRRQRYDIAADTTFPPGDHRLVRLGEAHP